MSHGFTRMKHGLVFRTHFVHFVILSELCVLRVLCGEIPVCFNHRDRPPSHEATAWQAEFTEARK
jgi:hypothetical protein